MKISLITTSYNSVKTIESTILSVISQSFKNIEYIIIDGGSSDKTLEVVGKYRDRIDKIISESDDGIYDALNKGVKLASGDIVGIIHSDDIYASDIILEKVNSIFENTNTDGVYGDLLYVNNNDKIIRNWKSKMFSRSLINRGWMPAHPTLFLKRDVYKKHGFFDTNYNISADYDFMLRILKDPTLKFEYMPEVITKMKIGGASNKSFKNIINKSTEDYKAIKNNKIKFPFLVLILKNFSKVNQFFKK